MTIPSTYDLTQDSILENTLLRRLMDKKEITVDQLMREITNEYHQKTWYPIDYDDYTRDAWEQAKADVIYKLLIKN